MLRLREGEKYEEHSHATILPVKTVGIRSKKVASLSEKECFLLDAVASPEIRFNVYSSPGLLEWGVGLKVGRTVLARLFKYSGSKWGPFQWKCTVIAHGICLEWS